MKIGVLRFKCKNCNKKVMLHYIPVMSEKTENVFKNLFNEKLCIDCYCNHKVEKLVECIM